MEVAGESMEQRSSRDGGLSRRNALKAGVAAGVGLAAWSGPSITSLGGTPAYAAGCTFVINIDLSGGCRNTTQLAGCLYGYQPLNLGNLPAGYAIVNNVPNNNCCSDNHEATLTFPAGITCKVEFIFRRPPGCTGTFVGSFAYGPESDGSLQIIFGCLNVQNFPSNTQYTITAKCVSTNAPESCLN